jgi:hypothetical protein
MYRQLVRHAPLLVAATSISCAHQPPAPAPPVTACLSAAARRQLVHDARGVAAAIDRKLDPALRALLRDLELDDRCVPEELGVIVSFRGDTADLERAGVTALRANRHPDGTFLGTGQIKTSLLPGLVAVDHLIVVDGGGHYTPD